MLQHSRKNRPHPTTPLPNPRGTGSVNIDNDLVPLTSALWRLGIHTALSCSHNDSGMAWIRFASLDAALRFLAVAASVCNRLDYRMNFTDPVPQPDVYFPHHYLPALARAFASGLVTGSA